jgi:hypothetical protein
VCERLPLSPPLSLYPERERERERERESERERERERERVRESERQRESMCVCVCVCEERTKREGRALRKEETVLLRGDLFTHTISIQITQPTGVRRQSTRSRVDLT